MYSEPLGTPRQRGPQIHVNWCEQTQKTSDEGFHKAIFFKEFNYPVIRTLKFRFQLN
jgi:hypothetical protein